MNKNIGIYKITNLNNSKVYIGQSLNIYSRLNGHVNALRRGNHQNRYLQRAFNKHGEESFLFETLENCQRDELYKRESFWVLYHNSHKRIYGYNIDLPSAGEKKRVVSEETGRRISKSKKIFNDKEELISYLQEFYYMENRIPTQRDLKGDRYGKYPSFSIYVLFFGNLKSALIEADLYDFAEKPFARQDIEKEEVIKLYGEFIEQTGRFPNSKERHQTDKYNLPAVSTVERKFGSYGKFKIYMGFTKEKEIEIENDFALKALKRMYDKEGYITARMIDKDSDTRSVKFYSNRFGSLFEAYIKAGIDSSKNNVRSHSYSSNLENFMKVKKNQEVLECPLCDGEV